MTTEATITDRDDQTTNGNGAGEGNGEGTGTSSATSTTATSTSTTSTSTAGADDSAAKLESLSAEVQSAQARIKELNKENEKRRLQLKEWEELQTIGVDPQKVKEMINAQKEAERKRKEEEGRYKELLEELESQTAAEKERIANEANEKVSKMQSALEKYFVDKTIAETLANHKASIKLLSKHIRDQVKVIEVDGEFTTVVIDSKGEPRTKRGGAFMTVDDLVTELKSDTEFAAAFPAPDSSGGGSTATSTATSAKASAAAHAGLKRSKMTQAQKYEFQKEHGMEAYLKLPM